MSYRQDSEQLGVYLQDQIRVADRWLVTLSARQDRVTSVTGSPWRRAHPPERPPVQRPGRPQSSGRQRLGSIHQLRRITPAHRRGGPRQRCLSAEPRQTDRRRIKFLPEGSRILLTAAA
ncbi:TonB-dependent receptor domain-containing protein [Lysobacter sp. 1R34A]|uniref:TonB-dependent receptor domain-containing protein n=1 Tax=Lysobacter sp. 1R34A TaxID=3445786 RepID=UPI003EEA069A